MIKLGFTGDVAFSGFFDNQWSNSNLLDNGIREFFSDCDATIINFENPITSVNETKKKALAHRSSPECAGAIGKIFTKPICSLANNHIKDFGDEGLLETFEVLKGEGIEFLGAGKDATEAVQSVILGEDIKVGLIALQYKESIACGDKIPGPLCETQFDMIGNALKNLRKTCDYVVVVYHGGNEFLHAPMPFVRKKIRKYIAMGADVVVAHHPHVVQGFDVIGGSRYVFYSLGNFIFDTDYQRAQEGTDEGIALKLSFDSDGISFDYETVCIDRDNNNVRVAESPSRYFRNLDEMGYLDVWTFESTRKKAINARAKKAKGVVSDSDGDDGPVKTKKQKLASAYRKNVMRFGRTWHRFFGKKNIWD